MKSTTSIIFSLILALALPWCLFGALVVGDEHGPVPVEVKAEASPNNIEGIFFLEPRRIPARKRTEPVGQVSGTPLAVLLESDAR